MTINFPWWLNDSANVRRQVIMFVTKASECHPTLHVNDWHRLNEFGQVIGVKETPEITITFAL